MLESLGIRHRFAVKPKTCYPNVPATLLPEWCKKGVSDKRLVKSPDKHKVRRRMGKLYSRFWITDEYRTSGVKISDAIEEPSVGTSVKFSARSNHRTESKYGCLPLTMQTTISPLCME